MNRNKTMLTKLFVLTGASGCGKTTLLNSLISDPSIDVKKAPKYSTRRQRNEDDDIIHAKSINRGNFDLVYKLNEKTYGIKLNEIKELLREGKNLFIILSDIRVISRLKRELKEIVVTIYIASAIDESLITKIQANRNKKDFQLSNEESEKLYKQYLKLKSSAEFKDWDRLFECMGELIEDWEQYIPEKNSTEIRKRKLRDFHKTYIDKIHLFDHVILNHNYGNPDEMKRQAINLLEYYRKNNFKKKKESPAVFIVSAASGSGKGTLMESIRDVIGIENIHITRKEAKRNSKVGDKRDGMIAIGNNGSFSKDFNLTWFFHKGENYTGTEYAVSKKEIKKNIRRGKPQIFISNMGQIEKFRKLLGDHAVFLYLHATRSDEEIKEFQYSRCDSEEEAKQRIKEIEDIHKSYIKHIADFDHVLLNTAFLEDLYEQMFKLIGYYMNPGEINV